MTKRMILYNGRDMELDGDVRSKADDYDGIEDRDDNVRRLFPRSTPAGVDSAIALQQAITAHNELIHPDPYEEEMQRATGRGVLSIVGNQPVQPASTDNVAQLPTRLHKMPLAHDDFPEEGIEREEDARERQFKDS